MSGESFLKPVDGRCWYCGSPLEPALDGRGMPTGWNSIPRPTTTGCRNTGNGLQSVIDAIGEHYLYTAREWGWNDTEVRDAVYVETKRRGWCQE